MKKLLLTALLFSFNTFAGVEIKPATSNTLTEGAWTDGGAITIGGTTSPPAHGTITTEASWYQCIGTTLNVRLELVASDNGTAGGGDYLFTVPGSKNIDTTKVTAYATVEGSGAFAATNSVGNFIISNNTDAGVGSVVVYDATRVRFFGIVDTAEGVVNDTFFGFDTGAAGHSFSANYSVPVTDC